MNQVTITFGTDELPDYALTWNVLTHKPASIWFKLVQHELAHNQNYFFRFTGFLNNQKTQEALLKKLQEHIDFINQDGRYLITEKAILFDQEFANKIHHHFEILAGSYDMPAKFYRDSTIPVREAIEGLNHCIHDLEALSRNREFLNTEKELEVFSGVVLELKNCYRAFIPGSFYKFFTLNIEFGDMEIGRAHV